MNRIEGLYFRVEFRNPEVETRTEMSFREVDTLPEAYELARGSIDLYSDVQLYAGSRVFPEWIYPLHQWKR